MEGLGEGHRQQDKSESTFGDLAFRERTAGEPLNRNLYFQKSTPDIHQDSGPSQKTSAREYGISAFQNNQNSLQNNYSFGSKFQKQNTRAWDAKNQNGIDRKHGTYDQPKDAYSLSPRSNLYTESYFNSPTPLKRAYQSNYLTDCKPKLSQIKIG